MNEVQASTKPFPNLGAAAWIDAYQEEILTTKDEATIEAYTRILEKFAVWLSLRASQLRPVPSPGDDAHRHRGLSRDAAQFQL